ncbi:hypothetical protein HMPREF0291_11994 [Corynebacterium genitalium ATCC 33030]|uniref:Uncharacterized protein n=1 Tax=Corynebacterium genitalium ATCC 33030 TaxID=585529 RepID=D7WDV6_9CORY|nr:hypothetical protein HMPREF0291_11994 [Corynebacterium genitalium ATCC 33030]
MHQETKGAIAMNGDRQRLRGHYDEDFYKRTYFGHPPAEASLESRV